MPEMRRTAGLAGPSGGIGRAGGRPPGENPSHMRRLKHFLVLSGALALAMAPSVAHAAPAYVTSSPENHEELDSAPSEVRVVFDTPLDPASTIRVVDQCNDPVDDGAVVVAGNSIHVGISETPKGPYFVYWKVRAPGGVGGGDALGKIVFHVNGGEYCGPPSERVNGDGHDGHGSGDGGGDGKHDGHGDGKSGGGKHRGHGADDGQSGSSGHSGSSHSSPTGAGSSTSHSGHSNGTASGRTVHAAGHTSDKGKEGQDHSGHTAGGSPLAAPEPQLLANAEDLVPDISGSTVLAALMASVVLGAAGGFLIRNLGPA